MTFKGYTANDELPNVIGWGCWVDYYRASIRAENWTAERRLMVQLRTLAVAQQRQGLILDIEPWKFLQYRGEAIGAVQWGEGEQGALIQASGAAAHELFRQAVPVDNVARLDIALTVWFDRYDERYGRRLYEDVRQHRTWFHTGRPYKLRFIDGAGDGDTLYIGSRGSGNRFARVYDKWKESGDEGYQYAWRVEVELSGDRANEAARILARGEADDTACSAIVAAEMQRYHIVLPAGVKSSAPLRTPNPVEEDSGTRRLVWFQKQVRPSVEKLIAEGVKRETLLKALGLSDDT